MNLRPLVLQTSILDMFVLVAIVQGIVHLLYLQVVCTHALQRKEDAKENNVVLRSAV